MTETLTGAIARYGVSTSLDAIPVDVRELAKQVIFDEMASAHFSRRSEPGALAARYAAACGGPQEATILGTALRAPAPYAALANGTAGHGEEVDGAHVIGGHPGATIVHAAVAMAERQRVSGAELINAVVLGYDVGVRVVEACGGKFVVRDRHQITSDQFYSFGAAAAACRILGLDAERHCHAMALVSFQTNGLNALYAEKKHISKSFCNGQYAFAGVSAALMSAVGLEGNEDILGARHGLLDAWGSEGEREALRRGLGESFAITGANFKFLNAGYPIHTPVEAALGLVAENGVDLEAIRSITVGMPRNALITVDNREMHNICIQDMLAACLVQGGLALKDQPFPAMLDNPLFATLRPRINAVIDPDLEREQPKDGRGARVTFVMANGSSFSRKIDYPRGHSKRGGVTWPDLAEKWRGNLDGCDADEVIAVAQQMEHLTDVNHLGAKFRTR